MALELRCPQCNQMLRVGDEANGKRVRCPKCQTIFQAESGASAAPAPPAPFGAPSAPTPLASAPNAPTVAPSLAPTPPTNPFNVPNQLGAPTGPAPLNPFATSPAPAKPANPFAAPADGSPFADRPMPPNPFAVPGAGVAPSPFAPPKDGGNPYASPTLTSYSPQLPMGVEQARPGLPWEMPGPSANTFIETAKLIMFSPAEAFNRMRLGGDLGNAILYYFVGQVLGQIGLLIWVLPLSLMQDGPEAIPGVGGNICAGIVGGIIGLFIGTAIIHLGLIVVGGAQQSYETTLRTLAYSSGSCAWLNVVPVVGLLIAGIWNLIASIVGIAEVHRCGVGKALFAMFFPLILCCVLVGSVGALIAIVASAR